ncbi:MAG: hypothetical protein ACPGD5_02190 [Salibacteraceae bacterium]
MKYTLYVGENCHDCKKVCKTIVEQRLDIPVKNLDKGDAPPFDLFILPAIVNEKGDLKAYGTDIIAFIKNPDNNIRRLGFFQRLMNTVREYC